MTKNALCKHCGEVFVPRRSNHVYCKLSCKTLASYKRNHYKYVAGHYQKDKTITEIKPSAGIYDDSILNSIKNLESKIESLTGVSKSNGSITSNAIGSVTADAGIYLTKKMLAPKLLPANKGDIESLKKELDDLKNMIRSKNINPFQI